MPSFLDFIFPKKCVSCGKFGEYFCAKCKSQIQFLEKPICPVCQRQAIGGKTHPSCATRYSLDGLVVACRYRKPVKTAIQRIKYKWIYDIGDSLVGLLSGEISRFDIPKNVTLVPVPLYKKRKNWRGFNQAEILAKNLAKKFKVEYAEVLIRNRETKTQVGLSRDERKKNVKGAFSLRHAQGKLLDSLIKNKNVVLIDDVYTSGATMMECSKVLKKANAKNVWGMVVALG